MLKVLKPFIDSKKAGPGDKGVRRLAWSFLGLECCVVDVWQVYLRNIFGEDAGSPPAAAWAFWPERGLNSNG